VYIEYLVTTPTKMLHDPSGAATPGWKPFSYTRSSPI